MKLRFRENTLRLRVNRPEVEALALGQAIQEDVVFPNEGHLRYVFEPGTNKAADASFADGLIRIAAPLNEVRDWALGESIGLYFSFPVTGRIFKVSIEKDLECVDGPPEESDPAAFPRKTGHSR